MPGRESWRCGQRRSHAHELIALNAHAIAHPHVACMGEIEAAHGATLGLHHHAHAISQAMVLPLDLVADQDAGQCAQQGAQRTPVTATPDLSADTLLALADAALYQAKRDGGGRAHVAHR